MRRRQSEKAVEGEAGAARVAAGGWNGGKEDAPASAALRAAGNGHGMGAQLEKTWRAAQTAARDRSTHLYGARRWAALLEGRSGRGALGAGRARGGVCAG